ncbi:MAG: hypothetical protein ACR2M6_04535 [Vampirovibrionia bacterium]
MMSQLNIAAANNTDIWETAGEGTIFGFNKDDLREKLVTDSEFRARFDEHFVMMTTMLKEIKADEKAKSKESKDKKEREKLVAALSVIEDRDNYSLKDWEGWNWSNTEIKKWIKDYKDNAKKAKAETAAKVKKEKEDAQRAVLIKKMDKIDVTVENSGDMSIDELSTLIGEMAIRKKEEKDSTAREKFLKTLRKIAPNVEGIPDFESDEMTTDEMKRVQVRAKLLHHLAKLNDPLDYENSMDNKALKARLTELKTVASAV